MPHWPVACADWQAVPVTDQPSFPDDNRTDSAEGAEDTPLETLVGAWTTVPDAAERLGLSLAAVRRLIEDRELLSARIGERRVVAIPEQFLHEDVFRHLRGTFTVLADGGLNDEEILRWLFTVDPTLRTGGTPVDALQAGFKTEVRRRAMEQAF